MSRHLRESLEPAAWIAKIGAERWLDFGSGAGLPAIPLAIAGLGSRWTLVESRRTKTLFLRKTISELALEEITVIYGRLEVLIATGELHARFEGFTSRATLTLAPTLALAAKIVVPGGYAFLWKGGRRDEEMQADAQWREYWELDDVMAVGDGRTAVVSFKRRR